MSTIGTTVLLLASVAFLAERAPAVGAGEAQLQRAGDVGSRVAGRSLETIARDLSDKGIEAWGAARAARADNPVDVYLALGAFSGMALAYSQLAAVHRSDDTLRPGAVTLLARAREIDDLFRRMTSTRAEWRRVQEQVAALSDYFRLDYMVQRRGRIGEADRGGASPGGLFRWEGRVDGRDMILVRGDRVTIRHLENNPIVDPQYEFVEPLPRQPVNVRLTKLAGRGKVEVTEQPSARNGYTVTILIEDPGGGDDFYRFELSW